MKQALAGLVVGFMLGNVAPQIMANETVTGYYNAGELLNSRSDTFSLGYTAGISDSMYAILDYIADSGNTYEDDFKELSRRTGCLRLRGRNLGALHQTAKSIWGEVPAKTQGAVALIFNACE
jgi:hypothetical protein